MENNKFRIRKLDKWRRDSEAMFSALGLRKCQYEALLGDLADLGTEKIIRDNQQFLFAFDRTEDKRVMAQEKGVCVATLYNHRTEALAINSKFSTGN